jgi:hypothetical protein
MISYIKQKYVSFLINFYNAYHVNLELSNIHSVIIFLTGDSLVFEIRKHLNSLQIFRFILYLQTHHMFYKHFEYPYRLLAAMSAFYLNNILLLRKEKKMK